MEKSCENCKPGNRSVCMCENFSGWQPDYPTLKQELIDTQQALEIENAALSEACQVIVEFQQRLNGKYLGSDQIDESCLDWEKFLRSRQTQTKLEPSRASLKQDLADTRQALEFAKREAEEYRNALFLSTKDFLLAQRAAISMAEIVKLMNKYINDAREVKP